MSLGTNTVKLHQVYLALDCHQYSKAVKLASALPPDHVLGKALLAHALQRSGQRYKSLCVIQTLLGKSDWYYELDYELKRCVTAANTESSAGDSSNATTASSAAPNQNPSSSSSSSSKKKKGKKQGKAGGGSSSNTTLASSTNAQSTKNTTAVTHVVPDLVSWLQQPRVTPENWDTVPPTGNDVIAITDETTLATIAVTLQATRLYVTIYQMYAVASNALTGGAPLPPKMKPQDVNTIVTKSFLSGLHLLLEENFPTSQALASMQITAMQLARLASANDKAPLWAAARTALWQLDFLRPDDEKASQKQLMLPRLAESLASKAIGIDANNITEADGGTTTAASAEEYFVFLETLKRQGKLEESLQLLQTLEDVTLSTKSTMAQPGTIPLSIRQIRELKAELLIQMDRHNDAAEMYEVLITEYVDQWSYWIAYLDCINQSSHAEEAVSRTEELRTKVVDSLSDAPSNSIPRGPHLLSVELAAVGIRGIVNTATSSSSPEITTTTVAAQEVDEEKAIALQKEIRAYGELFSTRASCAFSDLFPYLEVLSGASKDVLLSLLEWSNSIRSELCSEKYAQADGSDDASLKERKARLRGYIFAVKVSYKVVEMLGSNEDDLVGWQELATEWKVATALSSTAKEESENSENSEVQKENQPGDDLILLAVQQLLFRFPKDKAMLVVAATLAEAGIEHSPYNAYLKITAMDVYSRCNATSRAWELYQKMTIKHIQLDSCSYLILPLLVDGGLYNESVLESNHVVKLHGSTAKDTGEYMARAMEQGTLSKANEFLLFQRERMNTSLSLLDAKGRIMDCAPLVHFGTKTRGAPKPIAAQHGIVGAETDLERAANMVKETHNHYGAPSILTSPVLSRSVDHYRDNRDLTIISHQILNQNRIVSKDQIVSESKRRGHVHGFLIRSVLCVDACKGPKKGKVQKSSDTLKDRCNSLIDAANSAETFIKEEYVSAAIDGYSQLFEAMLIMLRVLGIVSAGMPLQPGETDSLSVREQRVSELLLQGTAVLEDAKVKMDLESDPEWTNEKIRIACRLLPDCVVPLFAMLEMNGNLFTTFGWGKRKRFTKNGAAALADFALSFRAFILSMKGALLCLPDDLDDKNLKAKEVATDVGPFVESGHLPDDIAKDSIKNLIRGQGVTRDRVVPFLDYVVIALDAFDIKEES